MISDSFAYRCKWISSFPRDRTAPIIKKSSFGNIVIESKLTTHLPAKSSDKEFVNSSKVGRYCGN